MNYAWEEDRRNGNKKTLLSKSTVKQYTGVCVCLFVCVRVCVHARVGVTKKKRRRGDGSGDAV